jgi:hypothetical protein
MATVWATAKCLNFMHNTEFAREDGFYPFKNLAVGPGGRTNIQGYESHPEVRQWPTPCSGANPVPGNWRQFYDFSRNSENGSTFNLRYDFGTPTNDAFTAVRAYLDPPTSQGAAGASGTSCAPRILTGVTVIRTSGATNNQPDAVCTNPGCTYLNGSCSAAAAVGPGGPR